MLRKIKNRLPVIYECQTFRQYLGTLRNITLFLRIHGCLKSSCTLIVDVRIYADRKPRACRQFVSATSQTLRCNRCFKFPKPYKCVLLNPMLSNRH